MYDCYRNSHYRITMGVIDSYGAAYGCYKAAWNTTEYGLAQNTTGYVSRNVISQIFDGEGHLRELTNKFV